MKMKSISMPARLDMLGMVARMVEMIFLSCGQLRASLKMRRSRPERRTLRLPPLPESSPAAEMPSSMSETTTTTPSKTLNESATYPRGFKPTILITISSAKYVVTT